MTNEQIQAFIKESKYSMTLKEWNYIKKQAKKLAQEYNVKVEFYKKGKTTEIEFIVDSSFLNIPATILRTMGGNYISTVYNEKHKELKRKMDEIVNRHEVVYDKSDIMTDYHGLYRLSHYTKAHVSDEICKKMEETVKELYKLEKSDNSFTHANYNKIAEVHELPLLEVA